MQGRLNTLAVAVRTAADAQPINLRADWFPPATQGAGSYLYLHGFRSVRASEKSDELAARAVADGMGFLRFDFRGHGESTGTVRDLTLSGLLEDALAVTERLPELGGLHLVGSSMGGVVALKMAALSPRVRSLLLVAPAAEVVQRWATLPVDSEGCFTIGSSFVGDTVIGPAFLRDAVSEGWAPDSVLTSAVTQPTMVVHGALDDCVPVDASRRLYDVLPKHLPKRWIVYPNGGHRLNESIRDSYEAWRRFVDEVTPP